jgi:hypothetical protein
MAILTQSGRTAIALSMRNQTIHLAWGQCDLASVDLPENLMAVALENEVGRVKLPIIVPSKSLWWLCVEVRS